MHACGGQRCQAASILPFHFSDGPDSQSNFCHINATLGKWKKNCGLRQKRGAVMLMLVCKLKLKIMGRGNKSLPFTSMQSQYFKLVILGLWSFPFFQCAAFIVDMAA